MSIDDALATGQVVVIPVAWPADLLDPASWMSCTDFRSVRLRQTPDGIEASMEGVTWMAGRDVRRNLANEALSRLHPGWDAYAEELARQNEARAKMGWN